MTLQQEEWTRKRVERLDAMMSMLFPLKQEEWEAVNMIVNSIVATAKGNEEVREEFLKLIEKWDLLEKEKRKKSGK